MFVCLYDLHDYMGKITKTKNSYRGSRIFLKLYFMYHKKNFSFVQSPLSFKLKEMNN